MRIPDSLLYSTVFLYPDEYSARGMENVGGSGLVLSVTQQNEYDDGTPFLVHFSYIVTCRHVVLRAGGNPCVVFNSFKNSPQYRIVDRWHFHPNGDDLAIAQVNVQNGNSASHAVDLTRCAVDFVIERENIGIGDQVFMIGRIHVDQSADHCRVLPAARFGNVSTMPAQPVYNMTHGMNQESYLVEMYSFGGFSGAPVFVRKLPWSADRVWGWYPHTYSKPDENLSELGYALDLSSRDEFWLLGINWGHLPQLLDIQQRDSDKPEENLKAVSNHNIACVVPAGKIIELLQDEEPVSERKQVIDKIK